jgi:hypothetical protein
MLFCHATSIRTVSESITFPSFTLPLSSDWRAATTSRLAAACSAAVRACPMNQQRSFVENFPLPSAIFKACAVDVLSKTV